MSINHIRGYHHYDFDRPMYTYFQRLQPVARAGYSISIYHVTPEQAAQLRAELHADEGAGGLHQFVSAHLFSIQSKGTGVRSTCSALTQT